MSRGAQEAHVHVGRMSDAWMGMDQRSKWAMHVRITSMHGSQPTNACMHQDMPLVRKASRLKVSRCGVLLWLSCPR